MLFGEEDQGVLPRLAAMLGGLVPAFRGVTTCFYSGLVTAMNPTRDLGGVEVATACGTATPGIPKSNLSGSRTVRSSDEPGATSSISSTPAGTSGGWLARGWTRRAGGSLPTPSCMPRVSGCALNGPGPDTFANFARR